MGTTVNYAIPYPGVNDAPDGPFSFQAGAEATDAAIKGQSDRLDKLPVKVATGSATLTFGAGVAFITSNVALPAGFTVAPIVTVTLGSNVAGRASLLLLSAYGATTSGFTIKMQTSDNANIGTSYNITFQWTAIQS